MFKRNNFVRRQKAGIPAVLVQFVALSVVLFICIIGVVAFVHFSSGSSDAATDATQAQLVDLNNYEDVLVPVQTIPAGMALSPEMFRHEKKLRAAISADTPRVFEDIQGHFTKGVLLASQPINLEYLTTLQPINALTATIPAGYRAIAIAVDATSSVEGWAQPGARVDVIWVTSYAGRRTASVIASNAKVLSANRRVEGAVRPERAVNGKSRNEEVIPPTVTLLLTARDSMRVRLAALHGRLSLVLRGADDAGSVGSNMPIGERELYSVVNQEQLPQAVRNLISVTVKDRKTGAQENLIFENGQLVENKK